MPPTFSSPPQVGLPVLVTREHRLGGTPIACAAIILQVYEGDSWMCALVVFMPGMEDALPQVNFTALPYSRATPGSPDALGHWGFRPAVDAVRLPDQLVEDVPKGGDGEW